MQQLLFILYKFRFFIVFLILECLAIFFTIQNYSYHKSVFVNSTGVITGSIYNNFLSVRDYIHLKEENEMLLIENTKLKNQILKTNVAVGKKNYLNEDTPKKYTYIPAKIIKNSYSKQHNLLTLNIGEKEEAAPDLGVVNAKGVVGIIRNTSKYFSTVLSVLNKNSRINVRLKNSFHFGTMIWNGNDYTLTQIIDMPRQAIIKKGDTVVTGNESTIFPEGIPVGIIEKVIFENKKYHSIDVKLFNDMTAISNVQVIKNHYKSEQTELEKSTNNE